MPFNGGLEDNEHLKQQAADVQRRAQKRMATRSAAVAGSQSTPRQGPWWAFLRRLGLNRSADAENKS
jgi:hypothetical protein